MKSEFCTIHTWSTDKTYCVKCGIFVEQKETDSHFISTLSIAGGAINNPDVDANSIVFFGHEFNHK